MRRHLSLALVAAAPMLPFPDDRFTVPADTPTGRQVAFERSEMPRNRLGVPIDPTDYNRADGFSPGQAIVVKVPGLDTPEALRRTGVAPIDDPARSLEADAPVRVVDTRTRRPHLVWAELDLNPDDPAQRTLVIRPAVNFGHGRRYRVELRRLRDAEGRRLDAPEPWTFTVASAKSVTGRLLSIRDRAFAELGDTDLADRRIDGRSPSFTVNPDLPDGVAVGEEADGVVDHPDGPIARTVRGRITVPCFLDAPACPTGSKFLIGADGTPQRIPGNVTSYGFTCRIPRREGPLRPALYGHGLFGGQGEIFQGQLGALASEHGFLFCAVDWNGMATQDVPNAVTVLQDLSRFPTLVDHVQQGFLGFLLLGRAMVHPEGLGTHPAFQGRLQGPDLYYDGNSQGGIYGGALTAVAPDFTRAVLGVPGMNYSTLLQRSVDFDTYAEGDVGTDTPFGMYDNYPSELERPMVLSLLQMLWDRADPNGYAHFMTNRPLPNTPAHQVLLHVGFGDHQVADVTTEVQARTIGAGVHRPLLAPDRERYRDRPDPDGPSRPFWGVPSLADGDPGSGVVFWDTNRTPPPPAGNVPPREGEDPHEAPRRDAAARRQKSEFLRPDGRIVDVCGGGPCRTG